MGPALSSTLWHPYLLIYSRNRFQTSYTSVALLPLSVYPISAKSLQWLSRNCTQLTTHSDLFLLFLRLISRPPLTQLVYNSAHTCGHVITTIVSNYSPIVRSVLHQSLSFRQGLNSSIQQYGLYLSFCRHCFPIFVNSLYSKSTHSVVCRHWCYITYDSVEAGKQMDWLRTQAGVL